MSEPRTFIEKVWDAHVVHEQPGAPTLLYIDLHLVHEVTSPQAFSELRARGLKVRRPERVLATFDHSTPTLPADASGKRAYVTAEVTSRDPPAYPAVPAMGPCGPWTRIASAPTLAGSRSSS